VEKHDLLISLKEMLKQKGITPLTDHETDIYVKCDFSLPKRDDTKVHYEASVYFDDNRNTVIYWDCVMKEGIGTLSDSRSNRPYRYCNVRAEKGIVASPKCDVFHLAEIPLLMKRTCKASGWKFKRVFNRKDSLYPTLVISADQNKAFASRICGYRRKSARQMAGIMKVPYFNAK